MRMIPNGKVLLSSSLKTRLLNHAEGADAVVEVEKAAKVVKVGISSFLNKTRL